jgi:long-chain fatty acid transport protein
MSNTPRTRFVLAAALLAAPAVVLMPSTAHAGGFLTDTFGSDHGQPALSNAYSVYFNPAAMAGMKGSDLTLDGVFAARSLSFNRAQSALSPNCGASSATCAVTSDPTYVAANTGQATLFNVLAAPYLGFVTDFGGSNWRLGVAGYVPFGGQVSWDKLQAFQNYPGAPGAYDGPQRWGSISTDFTSIYGTLALAYRIEAAHLGIGVSASVIRTSIQDTRAHNFNGSDDVIENGKIVEGRSYLNVSGIQAGIGAGLYWEPVPTVHLGASYTSQPNFGTMRLNGTFQYYSPGTSIAPSNVDLLQAYPDVIRAGGAWRVAPDTELRLDLTYERWSVFQNQCIVPQGQACALNSNGSVATTNSAQAVIQNVPRNGQDTVKVRLGGAYWVLPQTEIFGSGAYETSSIKDAYEDPLVFDSQRIIGTLGVRHGFTKNFYGMAAYSYAYFLPLTVTDSAYNTYAGASKTPSENGSYSSAVYLLDLALSYVF